jgi:hypothetical protein
MSPRAPELLATSLVAPASHVCFFKSDDALRSRSVSARVLAAKLDVPAPPAKVTVDWQREVTLHLALVPGDVEALPLARTQARWLELRHCVQAMSDWTRSLGLPHLADCELALMACRGARYHHDGAQYGGAAFANLFLSEDRGLDLHFPFTGQRIPLTRGTAVLFDTGQPHAVIERGSQSFDAAHFAPERDCTQLFLTWELPIENAGVAHALQIQFDTDPATALQLDEEQVWVNGKPGTVCQASGRWCPRLSFLRGSVMEDNSNHLVTGAFE